MELRLTVQVDVDEMVWTQVDVGDWMESQREWTARAWIEAETASIVEDAGCVSLLG